MKLGCLSWVRGSAVGVHEDWPRVDGAHTNGVGRAGDPHEAFFAPAAGLSPGASPRVLNDPVGVVLRDDALFGRVWLLIAALRRVSLVGLRNA